jgi:glutaredoxin 3
VTGSTRVVMYTTGWCGYCERARALLRRKGVAFTEVRIDEHPAERETMIRLSGGRRTVPQVFVGDQHLGGSDEIHALDREGRLDELLAIGT